MRGLPVLLTLAALTAGAVPAAGKPYARTLTIREPLGATWTDELVHRDVTVRQPGVAAHTFALSDPSGRPVRVQVQVLEGTPKAVRRARLWWKMTLPMDRELAYRLTWRDDGRLPKGSVRSGPRPGGGLTVRRRGDRLVLSTGSAEVALAAPAKAFDRPQPLSRVPGPIQGVRPSPGQGPWCGTWRWRGPGRVRAVETTVEADGPLWARVRLRYVFREEKRRYVVAVRAVLGEPWIEFRETYRVGEGGRAALTLKAHLQPTEVLWLPWAGGVGRSGPAQGLRREPLAAMSAGGQPFATLRPRWARWPDAAQACLALGEADGSDRSRAAAVGAVMVRPAAWTRPYEQFPSVRAIGDGSGMTVAFPLEAGGRAWALLAGPVARFDTKGDLQGLIRRMADLPLDRVLNACVLAWKRDPDRSAPHILTTGERLSAIRADMAAGRDTPTARLIGRVLADETADEDDRLLAAYLAGRRGTLPAMPIRPDAFLGRAYGDAFLAPEAYPRRLPEALTRMDLSSAGRPAGGPAVALLGYRFTDPNYWPALADGWPLDRPERFPWMVAVPAQAAAMMPDHPHAGRWMAGALGQVRSALRRAVRGAGQGPGPNGVRPVQVPLGTERLLETLDRFLPVMRAAQHADLARPQRDPHGRGPNGADPFTWPEVRAGLEWVRHLHTPPDPRLGRRLLVTAGGGGWGDDVGRLFGIAAAGVAPSDPDLARLWMAIYRDYYGEAGSGDLATDVLLADPSLEGRPTAETDWPSGARDGFGAVLRSRVGSPREAFVAFRCGGVSEGGRGDAMSFHFTGAGVPIAPAWHTPAGLVPIQEPMHNRVTLGEHENMDAPGRLLGVWRSAAADVAAGQARTTHLRRMPARPDEVEPGTALARRRLETPARYRRWLMLVKHPDGSALEDYLVVRDEPASTEPATFNLFVLAQRVRQAGRRFRFDGQLPADAVLYLVTPEPENVTRSAWGWSRPFGSLRERNLGRSGPARNGAAGGGQAAVPAQRDPNGSDVDPAQRPWRRGELQQWVRVRARPGRPFLAVLYPCPKGREPPAFEPLADGRGVRVRLGEEDEAVYLASEPPKEAGGQAAVRRGGKRTVVVKRAVKPL